MTDIAWFVTFTVGLGVVFGTLEALVRTGRMGSENGRRISHVTACLYGIGIHAVLSMWWFVVVAGTFVVLMAVSKVLRILRSIHDTKRDTWGEVYMPLGLGLAAIVADTDQRVFIVAAAILGLADVAAGLVGDRKGSDSKTWAGSVAFVVVALAIFVAARTGLVLSVVGALFLAAVERISLRGLDNVTIPVVAAALLVAFE
jgi:dolichol kinase